MNDYTTYAYTFFPSLKQQTSVREIDEIIFAEAYTLGQRTDYRFETISLNEVDQFRNTIEDKAGIVVHLRDVHEPTFHTFLQIASKVEHDIKRYSPSCMVQADEISVKCDDDVTRQFNAYLLFEESSTKVYLVDCNTQVVYKMGT